MAEQKMTITIEYSEDSLFNGWDQLEDYDLAGSAKLYGEKLTAAVRAEYPDAEVEVEQTINDRVRTNNDDDTPFVEAIVSDAYSQYDWLVMSG